MKQIGMQRLDVERIRRDFPILSRPMNGKQLVYLDNGATSQKPAQVIDAISKYYREYNANVHRGVYKISEEATMAYEAAHRKVAGFINAASEEEIIFTKNCTEAINLASHSLASGIKKGDEIVISQMEHHSNLVPWQQLAKSKDADFKQIRITDDGELDIEHAQQLITPKTTIVALAHVSNVLGTINPVKEIAKIAHENDSLFVVDAAQSVPRMPVDVKKLDCDLMAFSGHKMLGPTGIGVLYGKKALLDKMEPFLYGGDMIREVRFEATTWNVLPWKFEAGTPPIAEGVGLGAAVDYLKSAGVENIFEHEKELTRYAMERLTEVKGLKIYGPAADKRAGVISFNLGSIHAHDVASVLDSFGIAIRGGHHCAMPLMGVLGIGSCARASFYLYNTKAEVDKLVEGLKKTAQVFEK